MIGKKNIVFGFLYLVLTASLGPYMLVNYFGTFTEATVAKQQAMAKLAQARANGYELELEPLSAEQIAKLNTGAVLAANAADNARAPIEAVKGGPHAHGNLEALLNIAAGVVLCFIAASTWLKQAISWIFILGAVLHSGMLYLRTFGVHWASSLLESGIGPVLVLLGLLLIGIAAAVGFRAEIVRDA